MGDGATWRPPASRRLEGGRLGGRPRAAQALVLHRYGCILHRCDVDTVDAGACGPSTSALPVLGLACPHCSRPPAPAGGPQLRQVRERERRTSGAILAQRDTTVCVYHTRPPSGGALPLEGRDGLAAG